jgi:hypothetical protein
MKRINLTKYGFMRAEDLDFNDDGSKFTCYRFMLGSDSHVSKTTYNGEVFLSAHVDGDLPYEVYSKLPNYNAANWTYNGVSIEDLTDEDLINFFNACVNHEKEYRAAEASIQYPTIAELTKQCEKIQAKVLSEAHELEELMWKHGMEAAVKLSKYEWANLQDCLKQMVGRVSYFNPKTLPQTMYKKSNSFTFVKENNNDLVNPTYWYKSAKEMFEKYKII